MANSKRLGIESRKTLLDHQGVADMRPRLGFFNDR
jgi:hypothetical protein